MSGLSDQEMLDAFRKGLEETAREFRERAMRRPGDAPPKTDGKRSEPRAGDDLPRKG